MYKDTAFLTGWMGRVWEAAPREGRAGRRGSARPYVKAAAVLALVSPTAEEVPEQSVATLRLPAWRPPMGRGTQGLPSTGLSQTRLADEAQTRL